MIRFDYLIVYDNIYEHFRELYYKKYKTLLGNKREPSKLKQEDMEINVKFVKFVKFNKNETIINIKIKTKQKSQKM